MLLKRIALLGAAVPVLGLALALGLGLPREACPVSSGCSRIEDRRESVAGCVYQPGSACYECEYWGAGGFRVCYESPDGTRSFCIEHQTVPF